MNPLRTTPLVFLFAALLIVPAAWAQEKPNPAMAPVEDVPGLPRVLLIGDSISIGYTVPVRELLEGKANVHRPLTNCGPTTRGLEHLDDWLGDTPWDVIHFNWGLHDLKYMDAEGALVSPDTGTQQVPLQVYEKNIESLVTKLKATGATLIFATTTPVPEGANGRIADDAVPYNEAALRVMKKYDVAIDDLHAAVAPHLAEYQRPANVHFTEAGSAFLASKVAESVTAALTTE